ncbi:MAG: type II toxin-antitoxin system death-on-curing family toxin [Burkholderiales bacterium]
MTVWRWIGRDTVLAIHDMQLAQHGGLDGINDDNLIESALARPQQLNAYGNPAPDVFDLAAAYGYGITKNHGFSDGNKRTGWILVRLFLADNATKIKYTAPDAIQVMLDVAAGVVTERQFGDWLRDRQVP